MIRVLLVDDHPVVRYGSKALLSTQPDIEVVGEAGSFYEALAWVSARSADVALVDLDLGADSADGIETARRIREVRADLRVLVFTAYDTDSDIIRAIDAGVSGYLVKDTRPDALFRAIRAAAAADGRGAREQRFIGRPTRRRSEHALTTREIDVLALAATGSANAEIAAQLFISEATVKTHLYRIFTKLDVPNRQAAVAVALREGLIRL